MKVYKFTLSILFLFLHTTLFSNQSFIDKALELKLYQDQYWLKLLHFEDDKSIINNKEFFISPQGDINPRKELISTITNIINKPNTICKYPARFKWLQMKLGIQNKKLECKKLDAFLSKNFTKFHIVFTSERYDSPSSIFGHTFLKIETDTIPYAINYSAKVPGNQNQFLYAYKGMTGKYPSGYTLHPFNLKDYQYRAQEFRDLIQFEIKYSKSEIENIMLHFYEIQNTQQDYYFIGRNCSSELIKLLDMGKYTSTFSNKLSNSTIPIDIVYILEQEHLLSKITTQYSKLKLFYTYQEKLDKQAKALLINIIQHEISIKEFDEDTNISFVQKKNIILASIAYIEMISSKKDFENKHLYSLLKLIKLSDKYQIESNYQSSKELKKNPISNKFHKLSFGKQYTIDDKKQFNFHYRYLYRNRFDLMDEIRKNGTVEFLNIKMRSIHNRISIDELIVLNLEAMPLSNEFFTNFTKKMSIGAKRLFYTDKLYSYFDYAIGYKAKINQNINYHLSTNFGSYYYDADIYKVSLQSSIEHYYKNHFINEIKVELNTYSNGIETQDFYFNNYIKLNEDSVLNISIEYKKDIEEYTNLIFNYSFLF